MGGYIYYLIVTLVPSIIVNQYASDSFSPCFFINLAIDIQDRPLAPYAFSIPHIDQLPLHQSLVAQHPASHPCLELHRTLPISLILFVGRVQLHLGTDQIVQQRTDDRIGPLYVLPADRADKI